MPFISFLLRLIWFVILLAGIEFCLSLKEIDLDMSSLTDCDVGENLKRQLSANTEFEASSNVPFKNKRPKVFAVRTYPELLKKVASHINRPTNESSVFDGTVINSSSKNDTIYDPEDDSFEPFEVDDHENQQILDSTDLEGQINIMANDEAMNLLDKESIDELEGCSESFENDLESGENCDLKEMNDSSDDLGSGRPKDSDIEDSGDEVYTSGDESAI